MSHARRGSLTDIFPDLDIGSTSRSSSPSANRARSSRSVSVVGLGLASSIRRFLGRQSETESQRLSINTVRIARWLKEESAKISMPQHERMKSIWTAAKKGQVDLNDVTADIEDDLIRVVYGSNVIELAGTSYNITLQLCRLVFSGKKVKDVPERDSIYEAGLRQHHQENYQESMTDKSDLRSRREVIQHAEALFHMITKFVFEGEDLSEELICATHAILYKGMEHEGDVAAGLYRVHPCAARLDDKRKTIFIRAAAIPKAMKDLVERYRQDIRNAEKTSTIDPYELAARVAHKFIFIHPFPDGNGRMKRIIMNAILLKYAGHTAPFGGEPGGRDEYLELAYRSGKKYHAEEGEVDEDDWVGHHELMGHILKHSIRGVQMMVRSGLR